MLIEMCGVRVGKWTVVRRHRGSYWICRCDCGKEIPVHGKSLRSGLSKSCGCLAKEINRSRRGPTGGGWKGGRVKSSGGYILVQKPDHPASQANGYVPEHRLVMESMIGRYLRPEETVHHRNGQRHDNRPKNLELWSSRQPKGQRVSDLLDIEEKYCEIAAKRLAQEVLF